MAVQPGRQPHELLPITDLTIWHTASVGVGSSAAFGRLISCLATAIRPYPCISCGPVTLSMAPPP